MGGGVQPRSATRNRAGIRSPAALVVASAATGLVAFAGALVDAAPRTDATLRTDAAPRPVAVSQTGTAAATTTTGLPFARVGSEYGPPPGVITALYQDRDGFIWIGSRDGLYLYDGHAFTQFRHDAADATSLADDAIRVIYEDRDDRILVGTNTGGLEILDRATWTFRHHRHDSKDPSSISHDSVYDIVQGRDGVLWVGTQHGLNRLAPGADRFTHVPDQQGALDGISHPYVIALHIDGKDRLWVATVGGGVDCKEPGATGFKVYRSRDDDPGSLSSDNVFGMTENPPGLMWFATSAGVDVLETSDGSIRRVWQSNGLEPTTLAAAGGDRVWVGTFGDGLHLFSGPSGGARVWRREPARRDSLADNRISSLLFDRVGGLWIGTWGGGLQRVSPSAMALAERAIAPILPDEFEDRAVTALCADHADGLWVGTRGGHLLRRAPGDGGPRVFLRPSASGTRIVNRIAEDKAGWIWVAGSDGLHRIDPGTGDERLFRHDPADAGGLGPGYVTAVLPDRSGRLWVGTGEGGLQLVDGDGRVMSRIMHDPANPASLTDNYVTAILEDRQGTLWVGTRSGGLNAVDPATLVATRYPADPHASRSPSHDCITSLLEDHRGRLWIGTAGGGLNRFEREPDGSPRFVRVTERDGLVDNDVMGLAEDDDGSLWVSTRRGLSRYDPDHEAFSGLSVPDGLPAGEFEPGSATRSGDLLVFGSVNGPAVRPAGTPFPAPATSPLVVTSLSTRSGSYPGTRPAWELDAMSIPYGEWVSIELALLEYGADARHRYEYNLGGEWIDLGSRRAITITDLSPGEHLFAARARNSQGVWSIVQTPLRIAVRPPFWMTNWFRAVSAALVLGAVVVAHRLRLRTVTRRLDEREALHAQREEARLALARAYERLRRLTRRLEAAKEDERKTIARELHDEVGPSLTAVIINLHLLGRELDAETRAKKIADAIDIVDGLVRRVSDLSLDLRPPLLDELGLMPALTGYLEAQAERTGLRIEVDAGPGLDSLPVEVAITAFRVAQEAVTNAIRHAGARTIAVYLARRDGRLVIEVTDDGRGFDVRAIMEGSSAKALGLLGMQERVGGLGGEMTIESIPDEGVTVRASLPLEVEA
jgi:signal transduction histidine kinase/ligand-binding sensor domain-containing protein